MTVDSTVMKPTPRMGAHYPMPLSHDFDTRRKEAIRMNLSIPVRRPSALLLTVLGTVVITACAPGGDGEAGASAGAGTESVAAAPSGGAEGAAEGAATVEDGAVMVTAADMAFNVNTIEAPADEEFVITFMNNDSAPHNISIYAEQGGEAIVEGAVIEGGQETEENVPALEAGEYYFQCDVHPDMNGTVVAG